MPKEPGINSPLYEPSFHIVLHQPEIPPNTGAIGRTCVALQAKLWLGRPLGFQGDEKTLRRAGLDYWQYLEWEVVNDWAALLAAAQGLGATPERMWMFSRFSERDYRDPEFQRGDWLIFGSETSGLPASLLQDPVQNLRIPTFEKVRSLNLASAAAVSGYEVARQVSLFPPKS